MKKATDQELIDAYSKFKSVWLVAEEFGMCGQSVHERLKKLNAINDENKWSESDIALLSRFYNERKFAKRDDFGLDEFASEMGRPKSSICRKARELGLTNNSRLISDEAKFRTSERVKRWHETHEHPRGMLGKNHTEEVRNHLSEISKNMWMNRCHSFIDGTAVLKIIANNENKNPIPPRIGTMWKGFERQIGSMKKYFRSSWEANFARFLDVLRKSGLITKWEHEPDIFWFYNVQRGCRMYCPDFKVWLDEIDYVYIEIKGWMDQRSKTKLERMKSHYPEETVILISKDEMMRIEHLYGPHIEGWELGNRKSFYGFRKNKVTRKGKEIRNEQTGMA